MYIYIEKTKISIFISIVNGVHNAALNAEMAFHR